MLTGIGRAFVKHIWPSLWGHHLLHRGGLLPVNHLTYELHWVVQRSHIAAYMSVGPNVHLITSHISAHGFCWIITSASVLTHLSKLTLSLISHRFPAWVQGGHWSCILIEGALINSLFTGQDSDSFSPSITALGKWDSKRKWLLRNVIFMLD